MSAENKKMNWSGGTKWWVSGDINGFFGLFSNSLTNFLTAIGLMATAIAMPSELVFGKIVPGMAISIAFGNFILAIIAKRMSIRENRDDVTAMPYGLSVPHYFAVTLGVMLPTYIATHDWTIAWATGITWNLIEGIIMLIGAFIGPVLKRNIPRPAMLGALAGFAITFIAAYPFGEVYSVPYIGLVCFFILMVGWFALKKLPFNLPAGAFAILVGTIIAWVTGYLDASAVSSAVSNFSIPSVHMVAGLFGAGFKQIAPFLPAAIPLGIYDFLESLDNLESADVAGEHYPVKTCMLVPAIMTIFGACLGSPVPTIIYIGHPGWKATGARIGYSILTGVAILLLAFTGLLELVSAVIPLVALLPILVYIGMVIGTQAFSSTDNKYKPAVIIAFLPYIASFLVSKINSTINAVNAALANAGQTISVVFGESTGANVIGLENALLDSNSVPYLGWSRLASGEIIIAMLIASVVYYTIQKNYKKAAIFCGIGAVLSFFGIIHAASYGINAAPEMALAYIGSAIVYVFMMIYRKEDNVIELDEGEE